MKKLTLLSLLFLTLFACRKDIDETNSIEETVTPPVTTVIDYDPEVIEVVATLFGTVNDESGNAIANAMVQLENNTTATDDNGRFVFKDLTMNAAGTFVKVTQDGFFQGSHRFFPEDGSVNYASIVLLTKSSTGNFVASDGGVISGTTGIELDFPANSIVSSNGDTYDGQVEVFARWIDPTANNLMEIMPGNLQGLNQGLEEVALASYGMMAVELESPSGQSLNLGNGENATLSFPVPAELLADAPSEIPLWSFNETFGIWVEEGSATLQGDKYVGEVSHFSFWNCDYPYPLINLSGTVVSMEGSPIVNAWVKLTMDNGGTAWAVTDNSGGFSGKVPKDEAFVIEISQLYDCDVVYTDNIGPFSVDTDLGDIAVDLGDALLDISGTVVDCNGDPVTNGWIQITLGNNYPYSYYVENGVVDLAIINCDEETELTVLATNLDDLEQGDLQTYTVVDPLDLGNVAACGNTLAEFLIITIDGTTTTFVDVAFVSGGPDSTFLSAWGGVNDYNLNIGLGEITTTGTYDGDIVQYANMFIPGTTTDYYMQCTGMVGGPTCGFDEMIITTYGNIGEDIIGTFEGEAEFFGNNGNTVVLPYTASFKIIRE